VAKAELLQKEGANLARLRDSAHTLNTIQRLKVSRARCCTSPFRSRSSFADKQYDAAAVACT
jgi:hypothetical protein